MNVQFWGLYHLQQPLGSDFRILILLIDLYFGPPTAQSMVFAYQAEVKWVLGMYLNLYCTCISYV